MTKFSLAGLIPDYSSDIDTEELERIVKDAVKRHSPGDEIKEWKYTEDGIEITLDSGEKIEIEVDWNEIILT